MSENKTQIDYKNRIDRVYQYIDKHLDSSLSLKTISGIAFFSPFHFHRIFKYITGETLNEYVTRRRIEKSALDLIHKNLEIHKIAIKYGFDSNATFTRSFKKYYGVSPTEFKKQNPNKFSKIHQLKSKNGQDYPDYSQYICTINNLKKWTQMNAIIEIKETPKLVLAGITHIGVNGVEKTFEKLIKWANSKNLLKDTESKMGRIFYDSFKVTPKDQIRMRIFLKTSSPFIAENEINTVIINKGKCIVGRFEITPSDFEKSWTGLFIWMNENGYKKSKENPFEIYHNDYRKHPENKFIVDLHIPIE